MDIIIISVIFNFNLKTYLCKLSNCFLYDSYPALSKIEPSLIFFRKESFSSRAFFKSILDWVNWASSSDILDSNTIAGPSIILVFLIFLGDLRICEN